MEVKTSISKMKERSSKLPKEKKFPHAQRSPDPRVKKGRPSSGSCSGSSRSSSGDRTRFPYLPSRSRTASTSLGSASSKASSIMVLADSYSRSRSQRVSRRRQEPTETCDAGDSIPTTKRTPSTVRNTSHRISSSPQPLRTTSKSSLRNMSKMKIHSSPCLKSPPNKKPNSSKCVISPTPCCFPLKSKSTIPYYELTDSDEEEISRTMSSRLRSFEAKRQKLHLFKTRCFSEHQLNKKVDFQLIRTVSDDFSDISAEEEASTINVFETPKTTAVGADTITFRSHIKYTCETFDKHMKDQYEGKIIDGKCVYSYWLFYQQVERFKAIGLENLEDALKSNDKELLRDCIDEMKHEVKLIHNMFLNYDSIHRIQIKNKRVMNAYAMMYERCGRFARLTRGGDIQPHEMIAMWDDIQQYIIDELLEQVFIDFCFFMQLQFIIPQKEGATSGTLVVVRKGPDTRL